MGESSIESFGPVKFFCDCSMLATLYGTGEVSFPLIGTKGFHVTEQRIKDLLLRACPVKAGSH